jgi:hypothetical protein
VAAGAWSFCGERDVDGGCTGVQVVVKQPSQGLLPVGGPFLVMRAGCGVDADEVVEFVPPCGLPLKQVARHETVKTLLGAAKVGIGERGGGVRVGVRARMERQEPQNAADVWWRVLVGQTEGGLDGIVELEAGPAVQDPFKVVGQGRVGVGANAARGLREREGKAAKGIHDARRCYVINVDAVYPNCGTEVVERLVGGEHRQPHGGHSRDAGERVPAHNQGDAGTAAR